MAISALIIDDEQLARDELKYLLDSIDGVHVIAQAANGIEAVELIEQHCPDLVFLDVQMPGLDGFAVLRRVVERHRRKNALRDPLPLPQIVFATAYDQYAVRAFDVNAVDYLLKPFDRGRVHAAVERVRARLAKEAQGAAAGDAAAAQRGGAKKNAKADSGIEARLDPAVNSTVNSAMESTIDSTIDSKIDSRIDALLRLLNNPQGNGPRSAQPAKLIVQVQNRLLLIDQAEICFAAIAEGVIRVVTRGFEGQSKCRTLEELMELLDAAHFWRAHRGFVVNIDHIREVMPWFKSSYQLRMNDKQQTEIPVSRSQTRRLKELFNL